VQSACPVGGGGEAGKERSAQLFAGGEALFGLFGEAASDDLVEFGGDIESFGEKGGRGRKEVVFEDLVDGAVASGDLKGCVAEEAFVEGSADAVDIATMIDGASVELFGRKIGGGSDEDACFGEFFFLFGAGDPKVGEFDDTCTGEHDIGGFDIAVDNALLMGVMEGIEELGEDIADLFEAEAGCLLGLADHVFEIRSVDEFHHDKIAIFAFKDGFDADDMGVNEASLCACFAKETIRLAKLSAGIGFELFDSDGHPKQEIRALVNNGGAALAQKTIYAVDLVQNLSNLHGFGVPVP
jgi:hypothetical protein